jgi:hypothetical protein
MLRGIKPLVALTLTLALVAASPGYNAARAFAVVALKSAPVKTGPTVTPLRFTLGHATINTLGNSSLSPMQLTGVLPQLSVAPVGANPLSAVAGNAAASMPQTAAHAVTAVQPVAAIGLRNSFGSPNQDNRGKSQVRTPAKSQGKVLADSPVAESGKGLFVDVFAALNQAPKFSAVNAEQAKAFGETLQASVVGSARQAPVRGVVAAQGRAMTGLQHRFNFEDAGDRQFGAPAGRDSIEAAVNSHPLQASGNGGDQGDGGNFDPEESGNPAPLPARIFAAAMAAIPALFVTLPLISGGAPLAGGFVLAASLGLISMPFLGPNTPRLVRTLPGLLLAALGLFTLVTGVLSGTGWTMGALVTLAGWGLYRFGKIDNDKFFDEEKILTAFFGALFGILGAGLVLTTPAILAASWIGGLAFTQAAWFGWAVTGLTWLSYPLSAMLLMHLPGWVGEGIESAARGIFSSYAGMWRVLSSTKRDTILRGRLVKYTEAKLELSKWNLFKVGALWVPVWVGEGLKWVIAATAGLALGLLAVPTMFLWGASHSLIPKSRVTKFLAAWNRTVFFNAQGSKKNIYNNALTQSLMRGANAQSTFVSILSAVGLAVAQVAWSVYAVVATPFLYVGGLFTSLGRTGGEYDRKLHSPSHLRVDKREDSPVAKPDLPDSPVSDLIPPGLFATLLAALPIYFFGIQLFGFPVVGIAYLLAAVALAATPLMPESMPKFVRQAPGWLLTTLGLTMMGSIPWLTFGPVTVMSWLGANSFWMGIVTTLAGLGFVNNITKLAKRENKRRWSVDDPEYIGAYLGALGLLVGAGASLIGLGGWLGTSLIVGGYLTSILLLMHLPRWAWDGVKVAFEGGFASIRGFWRVMHFWAEHTDFYRNLDRQKDYHLDGSFWEVLPKGILLGFIWVPMGILVAVEGVLALALGLAMGLLRAPSNWMWGAAYEVDPYSKLTRFLAGFGTSWFEWSEGFKKKPFENTKVAQWMSANKLPSRRPTLGAYAAFGLVRLIQLGWLLAITLGLPIILVRAVLAGLRNMQGEKKEPAEDDEWVEDKDDPDSIY